MEDSTDDDNALADAFEPDFAKYKADLRNFVGKIETMDHALAGSQQSFDDMMQATLDLANIIGPKWKAELHILVPALQSLQRRSRVMNSAIERFLKEV